MKNYFKISILLFIALAYGGCNKQILELDSLTEPISSTFYSNEQELQLALTGAYNSLIRQDYGIAYQMGIDNGGSDIGVSRGGAWDRIGAGTHATSETTALSLYNFYYQGIARSNSVLQNMAPLKGVISEIKYSQIEAQALALRAYHYSYLTEFFGDVPYIDFVATNPSEGLIPRTAKATVVDKILADLQTASLSLPAKWTSGDLGRITKGVALGLRARVALYNGRYDEAASSAKAVMDMEGDAGYSLYPDYKALFQGAETAAEFMLVMPFKDQFITNTQQALGSRNSNSWSTMVPNQSIVDSYEATDGLPIDESPLYDPHFPFKNRDPRLDASIVLPQTIWANKVFETHPDSIILRSPTGANLGTNKDCRKIVIVAPFCGYIWKKNNIEATQKLSQQWNEFDFPLMRYAEILLIYAEAKIELGQIDATVLNAINRIRARAYGVDIANTGSYPAITTTDQTKLREIIRRERKVELANEGFRYFDIRRWKIAEKVMPAVQYGRILDPTIATKVPNIDADCFVSYAGIESQYDRNPQALFSNAQGRIFNKNRDYLLPIPQAEIDAYASKGVVLPQNPGY